MVTHPELSEVAVITVVVAVVEEEIVVVKILIVIIEVVTLSNSWTPTCGRFRLLWFRWCLSQCL
jgi:hypothetical protein